MEWCFLNTGFHPGIFNMDFDENLVRSLAEGEGVPTIRIYGWNPRSISLGWNQSLDELDSERASNDGIDIVRRPTGGRAILHSQELTYSVSMPCKGKNVLGVYNEISEALVCGLRMFGADVSFEKSQPHFPTLYKSPTSAVCFASSARYEIQIDGKKLVGSAQRRYSGKQGEDVVLQHGSLLLGPDHKRLVGYLRVKSEDHRRILAEEIEIKTIDLSSALGREVTFDEIADSIHAGFEKAWGITLRSSKPDCINAGVQA
jgi:lipoate-protein ligase A